MARASLAPSNQAPLSDDEHDLLSDVLEGCGSPFDADGLAGLLHAVAIGPGRLAPSDWITAVLPLDREDPANEEQLAVCASLTLRFYNDVVGSLGGDEVFIPEPTEVEACEAFAAGFVVGAELDEAWRADSEGWDLLCEMAYLAERWDLLDEVHVDAIEEAFGPDVEATIRKHLVTMVDLLHARFLGELVVERGGGVPKVGRNDACPCGSGKKYKKCCSP